MIDHSGACLHKLAELAKVRELVSLGILSFKKTVGLADGRRSFLRSLCRSPFAAHLITLHFSLKLFQFSLSLSHSSFAIRIVQTLNFRGMLVLEF